MINIRKTSFNSIFIILSVLLFTSCSKSSTDTGTGVVTPPPPPPPPPPVQEKADITYYITKSDKSVLFAKQSTQLYYNTTTNTLPTINVDSTIQFQSIDGFGYTLTGGSAQLMYALDNGTRSTLLNELFSANDNGIGISYLRISIGASDLNSTVYTYDDVAAGATDVNLQQFSIDAEKASLIPLLKEILAINPAIKIIAAPWSAPVWMKENADISNKFKGGNLNRQYYAAYAQYFVKYLQAMKAQGITITAVTPQNEPLNAGNNPSMVMSAAEQADFIKNNLGPAIQQANLTTKIVAYDHNADRTDYPLDILNDAAARQFVDGSAFHLYGGNISALSNVHDRYPDKNIYFTEQYTSAGGNFGGDLNWHINNLIVGATRNWSKNVLEWNLANDPSFGPHTNGGCSDCLGALTISGNAIARNVSYYIISHASKFVRPGSVRIPTNIPSNLQNVAFLTPDGKKVLIVLNTNNSAQSFNITFNNKSVTAALDAGAVATYIW